MGNTGEITKPTVDSKLTDDGFDFLYGDNTSRRFHKVVINYSGLKATYIRTIRYFMNPGFFFGEFSDNGDGRYSFLMTYKWGYDTNTSGMFYLPKSATSPYYINNNKCCVPFYSEFSTSSKPWWVIWYR